jgi:hypothetical protein
VGDDEAAELARRRGANARCAFEKALLARCAQCRQAAYLAIAEREAVRCLDRGPSERCARLRENLRRASSFALQRGDAAGPLPHAAELKLQCGGLRGLRAVVHASDGLPDDVDALAADAESRFASLDALPFAEIVRQVAAYQARRRVK